MPSNPIPQAPKGADHVLELDEILSRCRAPWLRGADRDGLAHVEARARRQVCRQTEARRMVAEKGVAFAEAAATLATGGSMNKVVRRVRSRVSKNKRRLSR